MWYFNPIGIAIDVSFCIQMLLAEALMVFSLEKRDNFILRLTLCVFRLFYRRCVDSFISRKYIYRDIAFFYYLLRYDGAHCPVF